ncbi:MAG: hypothetical protein JWO72_112 [Caulobacteraceae bacterium]|nr:hypothetical protein [Caulobacteraceae bacterium]
MSNGQIHFEVFARRQQNGSLALEMATEDRARAMAYAEELLESGSCAVRVSKEVLDEDTGEYSSVTILTKGVAAPKRSKAPLEEAGPPCVAPADLYSVHARQRIVRLLEGWLGRNTATPFELLHRPDLAEKLEASGTDLQHAVQKIAIPEAQAKGVSVHEVIRTFNSLIERAIERLIKDGRRGALADFKTEPFAVACARLLDEPEGAYRLGGGVAAYLADAKTWGDKIDRLLDLADCAPADPRPRALAFEVLEQPLGEILGSKAGVAELLGPDLDLGGSLAALTRLAAGPAVEMLEKVDPTIPRVMPPLEGAARRLSRWMEGSYFQAVRMAIGRRVIAEIKSARRLRPSDANAEIDVLRALAMALTAGAGKMLSGDDIRDAFIERSSMLISAEFVTAAMGGATTAQAEVRALLRLAENVTGQGNKSQAAQWLIGSVTALRFEREMRHPAEPPMGRLGVLADLQRAFGRVDLPDADRQALAKRLGDLGGMVEADANVVASLTRSTMPPVQRLTHLLKMALGESAPLGPAATRAKDAAVKLGKSPDIRADLAKAPEVIERLRPLMQAAG